MLSKAPFEGRSRNKTMIEQALQNVKTPGGPVSPSLPDTKDNVSTYEKIRGKRAPKQSSAQNGENFTIERQFSSSSKVLAKSHEQFNKVLTYLETHIPSKPREETTMFAGLKISKQTNAPKEQPSVKQAEQSDKQENETKIYGEQLEFDIFPDKDKTGPIHDQKPPVEIKKFEEPPQKSHNIEQVPAIDIGNNPTDFKIHNIITDEIIKAISQKEPAIEIKQIGEHLASKLANEVRKQLANLPHAIAINEESAPTTVFDKTV